MTTGLLQTQIQNHFRLESLCSLNVSLYTQSHFNSDLCLPHMEWQTV